jgi:hypothetical protein
VFGGQRSEFRTRIHRPGVSDLDHQRRVLVAVGVEVTALQVNLIRVAEVHNGDGLISPPDDGFRDLTVEASSAVEREVVAQHVVDLEEAGHRIGMNGHRLGAEHHRMAAFLMRRDDDAHGGVDAGGQSFDEDSFADFVEVGQSLTL